MSFPLRLISDDVLSAEVVKDIAEDSNTARDNFYSKHTAGTSEGSHADNDRMVHPIALFKVDLYGSIPQDSSLEDRIDHAYGLKGSPTWHRNFDIPGMGSKLNKRVMRWEVPQGYRQLAVSAMFGISTGVVPFERGYRPQVRLYSTIGYLAFNYSVGGGFELHDIREVTIAIFGTRPKP